MTDDVQKHLTRADLSLRAAERMMPEFPSDAISRAYYAVFHAAKAVALLLDIDRSSHHALWSVFGREVANTELMPRECHKYALDLFSARMSSDYLADPADTVALAERHLQNAREFVAAAKTFIEEHTR
ncbi:MAG TPA: HEPN domain-containing protein [Firmicutes bacterium]|nr:HEPN domain-containing protein [Bacillota bacterium]